MQDRDGGRGITREVRQTHPGVKIMWADGGYAGRFVIWAKEKLALVVDIIKRNDTQEGFEVLPRRWVVERTFAWIMKCRRLSADYERIPSHSEAMVQWAMIGLMVRRIGRTTSTQVTGYNWP